MSSYINTLAIQLYSDRLNNPEYVVRGLGLASIRCFVCNWPTLNECPRCFYEQNYFRDTRVLFNVCPIVICEGSLYYHQHCATTQIIYTPWTSTRQQ